MIFKTKKNYEIQGLIIGVCVIFIVTIYTYISIRNDKKDLETYKTKTYGIVSKIFTLKRTEKYIGYHYYVNNQKYYNYTSFLPHLQNIQVGDTVYLFYSSKNPHNHDIIRNNNKRIIFTHFKEKVWENRYIDSISEDDFYLIKDTTINK